ncbi:MAG: hypothetical protein MJA84_18405, partial [Firmicutes bacterium]|nr:hypothetical protein [Bacillota bacterium]
MASSKKRSPRLGRGLSSLMARPVAVEVDGQADDMGESVAQPQEKTEANLAKQDRPADTDMAQAAANSAQPSVSSQKPLSGEHDSTTGQTASNDVATAFTASEDVSENDLAYIEISRIRPNPHQPRQHVDKVTLQRLA